VATAPDRNRSWHERNSNLRDTQVLRITQIPSAGTVVRGRGGTEEHAPLEEFQRQTRDLFIPVGDVGFWQGAFRDTAAAGYQEARTTIEAREPWTVELLYADHEGGQRAVTRFLVLPVSQQSQDADTGPSWLASASRHWSIDGPDRR
jgi:hypothetical protein